MRAETVPLYLLFEAGVLLASIAERRDRVIRSRPQPEGTAYEFKTPHSGVLAHIENNRPA